MWWRSSRTISSLAPADIVVPCARWPITERADRKKSIGPERCARSRRSGRVSHGLSTESWGRQLSTNQEEMRSATMIVGKFVLAEGMVGITEASATYNCSTP